jgi:oligosaccharyltransferase complex subunit beta
MARSTRTAAVASLVLCLLAASAAAAPKPKVLVLLDDLDMQQTHSKFLQGVKNRGYDMKVSTMDAKSPALREFDEWLFDKLIILSGSKSASLSRRPELPSPCTWAPPASAPPPLTAAPTPPRPAPRAGMTGEIKPSTVLKFFDSGRDVFLALGADAPAQLRALAQDLGVDPAPAGTLVIDHAAFNRHADDGTHTAVHATALAKLPAVFAPGASGPVLFRGVGLTIAASSEVAFAALTAPYTSYAGTPGAGAAGGAPLAGPALVLVALVQGRNNARAAVSGSVDLLSDAFFAAAVPNAPFAASVSKWAFRERGVLRASALRHAVEGGPPSPALYRISDRVRVELDLQECGEGGCRPYAADDVQVEFVMLDPHVRAALAHDGNGTFSASVRVPDVYGVFKWVVDYRRPGYSWVALEQTVPVRPFRHDEYERFIAQAYPYYTAVASMMAGFFALGFYFLYSA